MGSETDERTIRFLLAEYDNIAKTHDGQRSLNIKLFNYSLLLCAFPFTLASIAFNTKGIDILTAPASFYVLFVLISVGLFLLASAYLGSILTQHLYARTVNLIRSYFRDGDNALEKYLVLPTTAEVPHRGVIGTVNSQLLFIHFSGAVFVAFGWYGLYPFIGPYYPSVTSYELIGLSMRSLGVLIVIFAYVAVSFGWTAFRIWSHNRAFGLGQVAANRADESGGGLSWKVKLFGRGAHS